MQQFDASLLKILVCPKSYGALEYNIESQELVCRKSKLSYPIRFGVPILIEEEARVLTEEELYKISHL